MMKELLFSLSWYELLGVACLVVQVLLAKRNNAYTYAFGIMGVLVTIVVMANSGLYAEAFLNVYYLIMSVYGWFYWLKGGGKAERKISVCTQKELGIAIGILVSSFLIFYWVLSQYTNSTVAFWDSAVAAFAWVGMWLLARRKLENWVWLNISNFISVPLFLYKELYLYAALNTFLFIVAIYGYKAWQGLLERER